MFRKASENRVSRASVAGLVLSLVLLTGCPIDPDAVAVSVTEAALNAATSSFVESLSTFLEGT